MAHPAWEETETLKHLSVNGRAITDGACVELVHSHSTSGSVSGQHRDDVLCRYFSPALVRATVIYGKGAPQRVGRLMFAPAHVPNRVDGSGAEVSAVLCRFDHQWLAHRAALPQRWDDHMLEDCGNVRNVRIDEAMYWLAAEVRLPGIASSIAVDSLVSLITVELARYFQPDGGSRETMSFAGQLSPKLLERVREASYFGSTCPNVKEIADLCGCSATHLRRAFRASTGESLRNFIEGIRLERAKSLLAGSAIPVGEVARELGFPYVSGFSRAFRKHTGKSPVQYRFECGR